MNAQQMADASASIQREITSTVVEGLGKIESASLPIERLLTLFDVGPTWMKDDLELAVLDDRVRKQFDLKVDPSQFQPFRVQKHVIETLNNSTDVATQRRNYDAAHQQNKTAWNVSAGFGIGPFSASGGYSQESDNVTDSSKMTDDQFRQMVQTYHGATYDTEERLWRGVQVFDTQKVKSTAQTSIVSVTYKPTLSSGIRNITARPSVRMLAHPKPTNPNAPVSLYFLYPGTNARHDVIQLDATTWVENFSETSGSSVFHYFGREVVEGVLGKR